jgi:hypothetical protein
MGAGGVSATHGYITVSEEANLSKGGGAKLWARRHVVPGQPVAELRKARPDACRSAIRLQDESDFLLLAHERGRISQKTKAGMVHQANQPRS